MNFDQFADAIGRRFQDMTSTGLFRTTADKDALWATYLGSYPEGTNPIYKTRTQHDCSACRQFIKTLGGVVTIVNGEVETLWDVSGAEQYQPSVDAMAALVRGSRIDNVFLHPERSVGVAKNFSLDGGTAMTWRHFFVNLPSEVVGRLDAIGARQADARSTFDVMLRGLREITLDATKTVLELIAQGSLYRGEEHLGALEAFKTLQRDFAYTDDELSEELFYWTEIVRGRGTAIARIRNTAIGTLLVDLSNDVDLEDAVKSFEQKVAPTNYKRPTALVTRAMVEDARKKVDELGLTSALERRYATIDDVSINNMIFVDRSAKRAPKDPTSNAFDDVAKAATFDARKLDKVERVSIEAFIAHVLPQAESVEVLFENRHAGNLVSLVAPADPTARPLFKWPNNFSWSYAGDLADSIKERVKRAGGNVTGDFRASLSWHNYDDLDLHLQEPHGQHIYYANKRSRAGGWLDVDMNAGSGTTREPVENIAYSSANGMPSGAYKLFVNQFASREKIDIGFEVELEFLGQTWKFAYPKAMRTYENVAVAEFRVKDGKLEMIASLKPEHVSRTLWNIPTQTFHRVNIVTLSPNHWDVRVQGNRHFFFMLEGCRNDGTARGFFNEFLSEELTPHRKVLEVVGARMRTDESERQLSGLGFSSTQRNSLLVRVKGSFTRTVNVMF